MPLYSYILFTAWLGLAMSSNGQSVPKYEGKSLIRMGLKNVRENMNNLFNLEKETVLPFDDPYIPRSQRGSLFSKLKKRFADAFRAKKKKPAPKKPEAKMPARLPRGWVAAELGQIPDRAFTASYNEEQKRIYVARCIARRQSAFTVGQLVEGSSCVKIVYGEYHHCYRKYQVLVGEGFRWMQNVIKNKHHPDGILGDDKYTHYVCRRQDPIKNTVGIGNLGGNTGGKGNFNCWFGAKGKSYSSTLYEILLDIWV